MLNLYIALFVAYILGSMPNAVIVTHYRTGQDLRRLGDGNLGARNVFLSVGRGEGLLVGLLDIIKGAAAVLFAQALGLSLAGQLGAGLAAVMGHNWPIFHHFDGGQGMAATIGVFLALLPTITLICTLLIALVLAVTRNWDLACGVGLVWIPLAAWLWAGRPELSAYAVGLLPLILLHKLLVVARRRRQNINHP